MLRNGESCILQWGSEIVASPLFSVMEQQVRYRKYAQLNNHMSHRFFVALFFLEDTSHRTQEYSPCRSQWWAERCRRKTGLVAASSRIGPPSCPGRSSNVSHVRGQLRRWAKSWGRRGASYIPLRWTSSCGAEDWLQLYRCRTDAGTVVTSRQRHCAWLPPSEFAKGEEKEEKKKRKPHSLAPREKCKCQCNNTSRSLTVIGRSFDASRATQMWGLLLMSRSAGWVRDLHWCKHLSLADLNLNYRMLWHLLV